MLALFLFGGETLRDFAFALIVGTLSGTYSSVFIAGPVLTHWKEREPVYRTRHRRIREEFGYVPAYAVATTGAPVDVEPERRRRARPSAGAHGPVAGRLAAGVRRHGAPTSASSPSALGAAAGRGRRGRGARPAATARPGAVPEPAGARAGAAGSGEGAGVRRRATAPRPPRSGRGPATPKKPRNRRHGRPR